MKKIRLTEQQIGKLEQLSRYRTLDKKVMRIDCGMDGKEAAFDKQLDRLEKRNIIQIGDAQGIKYIRLAREARKLLKISSHLANERPGAEAILRDITIARFCLLSSPRRDRFTGAELIAAVPEFPQSLLNEAWYLDSTTNRLMAVYDAGTLKGDAVSQLVQKKHYRLMSAGGPFPALIAEQRVGITLLVREPSRKDEVHHFLPQALPLPVEIHVVAILN